MCNLSLIVYVPETYLPERAYVQNVLLKEFLGLNHEVVVHGKPEVVIKLKDSDKTLVLADVLFQAPAEFWLKPQSLPQTPLPKFGATEVMPELNLCEPNLPVLYGKPLQDEEYFSEQGQSIYLGIDIFGSCFFILTRYEEAVLPNEDEHGRFPAKCSISYKEKFLERPLVNEYLEVLWAAMKRLWPGLERKQQTFKVLLTHDVDSPFAVYGQSWYQIFRNIAGDFLFRKDYSLISKRIMCKIHKDLSLDPNNTFDFIMDISEKHGFMSEFYFITDQTSKAFDGKYSISEPYIQCLMERIYKRGHRIGLHASYNSYLDVQQTKREFESLLQVAERLKIKQDSWGGRQHYLRWKNPITWQNWEDAGLNFDSTISFADHVGFRAGTCYEYPVFNLLTRQELRLQEKPLIVTEGTLFGANYMGLNPENAMEYIEHLFLACKLFGGTFVLLWHNSSLIKHQQKRYYQAVVELIS